MTKSEKIAFAIAPLVTPLAFVIGISGLGMEYGIVDFFETVLMIAVFSLPVAYLITYTLGLIAYKTFKKKNLINPMTLIFGSIAIANIPPIIIWLLGGYEQKIESLINTIQLFSFIGLSIAIVFFLLSKQCYFKSET